MSMDWLTADVLALPWVATPTVTIVSVAQNVSTLVVAASADRKLLIICGDAGSTFLLQNQPFVGAGAQGGIVLTIQSPLLVMTTDTFGLLPTLAWYCFTAAAGSHNISYVEGRLHPTGTVSMLEEADNGTFKTLAQRYKNGNGRAKLYSNLWPKRKESSPFDLSELFKPVLDKLDRAGDR